MILILFLRALQPLRNMSKKDSGDPKHAQKPVESRPLVRTNFSYEELHRKSVGSPKLFLPGPRAKNLSKTPAIGIVRARSSGGLDPGLDTGLSPPPKRPRLRLRQLRLPSFRSRSQRTLRVRLLLPKSGFRRRSGRLQTEQCSYKC